MGCFPSKEQFENGPNTRQKSESGQEDGDKALSNQLQSVHIPKTRMIPRIAGMIPHRPKITHEGHATLKNTLDDPIEGWNRSLFGDGANDEPDGPDANGGDTGGQATNGEAANGGEVANLEAIEGEASKAGAADKAGSKEGESTIGGATKVDSLKLEAANLEPTKGEGFEAGEVNKDEPDYEKRAVRALDDAIQAEVARRAKGRLQIRKGDTPGGDPVYD